MAFTDFKSIQQVQKTFQIKYTEEDYIDYDEIEPSQTFWEEFTFSQQNLDIFSSEASRCENVIYPILRDVYKHYVEKYSLWSHKSMFYDQKLTGIPDYLISTKSELGKTILGIPILVVVEAKQNNFTEGWGQCLAELVAAQKINQNDEISVHGIVTDGELWHFGKLQGNLFTKNRTVLAISEIKKIFGAVSYLMK
jgi:type IV secretory pathway VirB2 component (pilin)